MGDALRLVFEWQNTAALEELGAKDTPALEVLLRELQARVRLRGPGAPE